MNKVDITGRHARWQVILSEFNYEIKTCPGNKNGNADALSRIPRQNNSLVDVNDEPLHFSLLSQVVHAQWVNCPWYKDIYLFLKTLSAQGGTSSERERVRKKARRFTRQDGQLRYLDADDELKDCLTEPDIKRVLHKYHDGAIGGHFG